MSNIKTNQTKTVASNWHDVFFLLLGATTICWGSTMCQVLGRSFCGIIFIPHNYEDEDIICSISHCGGIESHRIKWLTWIRHIFKADRANIQIHAHLHTS